MIEILSYANISKQAHWQALERLEKEQAKAVLYVNLICEVRETHPGMGLRTIYEKYQPEGIGRDAFIRLGVSCGFLLEPLSNGIKTTYAHPSANYANLLVGRQFTDVNQVWCSDITYFRLQDDWCYLTFIMDVYSRRIVGYAVSENMKAYNNVTALQMALTCRNISNYNKQLIHHSDRGSQYISDLYTSVLMEYGINISMCANVLENAHIERVNGTIKNQYLQHWDISSFKQLVKATKKAVDAYNYDRPHTKLNGKSPVEFEHFIKELSSDLRPSLEIFVYNQNVEISDVRQLSLQF